MIEIDMIIVRCKWVSIGMVWSEEDVLVVVGIYDVEVILECNVNIKCGSSKEYRVCDECIVRYMLWSKWECSVLIIYNVEL